MKMRVCLVAIAFLALALGARGEEKAVDKTEEQLNAVGAARAKAELAYRRSKSFFQNEYAFSACFARIEELHARITNLLGKQLEAERRKNEVDRNPIVVESLEARITGVEMDFQQVSQREHQELDAAFRAAAERFRNAEQAFTSLQNIERVWLDGYIDTPPLTASYEQMAKALDIARGQGKKYLTTAQEKQKAWETRWQDLMPPEKPPAPPAPGKEAQNF